MTIIIDNNGEILALCDQGMADKQLRKGWAVPTTNPNVLQALGCNLNPQTSPAPRKPKRQKVSA